MIATPNTKAMRTARELRGLEIAQVAAFAQISPTRLVEFEEGAREPSRKQMQRLANTYGVPLYSLFGDGLPNIPPLPLDFRKRNPEPASISPSGLRSLLSAERIATFSRQIATAIGYEPTRLKKINIKKDTAKEIASEVRSDFDDWYLKHLPNLGLTGPTEHQFMSALRLYLEVRGVLVNINSAPSDDFMGFYLESDSAFPSIFINRLISSKKAQLFTLAHEYCHALKRLEGISNPFLAKNQIERTCNIFAAEFLAPEPEISRIVNTMPKYQRADTAQFVNFVSSRTLLSKHATAIRLTETDYISNLEFRDWRRIFSVNIKAEKEEEKDENPSNFGAPHAKRISELGYLSVYLAKIAEDRKYIDSYDVADGLGLSPQLQDRAYTLATKRFVAAQI